VGFEYCVFLGSGLGVRFADWPGQIVVKNSLKTGAGLLFDFGATQSQDPGVQWNFTQVTLRGASGLSRCEVANSAPAGWSLRAEDCVWELHEGSSALFQATGTAAGRFFQRLQFQGQNCLLNDSAVVAGWWNPAIKKLQAVDASQLQIEGLVLARLKFRAALSPDPKDAVLIDWQGPRFSAVIPGFRALEDEGEKGREGEGEKNPSDSRRKKEN
jgi:hypothetical protein